MTDQQLMTSTDESICQPNDASYMQNPENGPASLEIDYPALSAHYHNLEKIGHGAQATMLKALDAQEHPVAIKVFDYGKVSDWKDVDLFEREIDVLKNLNIDGVPKYIETIKTDKVTYLVESYIDAPSLEKQIKNGRIFTFEECITILENTANILKKLGNRHQARESAGR